MISLVSNLGFFCLTCIKAIVHIQIWPHCFTRVAWSVGGISFSLHLQELGKFLYWRHISFPPLENINVKLKNSLFIQCLTFYNVVKSFL